MALANSLTCISSAMDDMQMLENLCPKSPDWIHEPLELAWLTLRLGAFRTFLLCARKWVNEDDDTRFRGRKSWRKFLPCATKDDDASLGALMIRMKAVISKMGTAIHAFYLTSLENGYGKSIIKVVPTDGEKEIRSFYQEINQWYLVNVSEYCSSLRASNSQVKKIEKRGNSLVKMDNLMEFMNSVLEHLRDILYTTDLYYHNDRAKPQVLQEMLYDQYDKAKPQALHEMLTFLRNIICFGTFHGLEDRELGPLLSYAEFVTVNTASLSYVWIRDSDILMNSFSDLLPKIIPLEVQVHETCVKLLISSKFSTQPYGKIDERFLRNFVDSLLFYLWQILKTEACLMISLKDQLQMLWEGLISLRTILKGNPEFDEKMRDLTRLLLCDAGLVLFSLSFSAMKDRYVEDVDLVSFKDFVERLKLIKATITVKSSETSYPRTDVLGFLAFLLKHMIDLTSPEEDSSVVLLKFPIQTIHEDLVILHSLLEKIVKIRREDEELQALWNHVAEVAYKVEFLIDSLLVGDILYSCSMLFDSIVEEIKIIKDDALKMFDTKRLDLKVKEITKRANHLPTQESKPMINNVVVGFEDEATLIINRLTRGSSRLQIVPIVGMSGLGKTTLAKKIYNDFSIKSSFFMRCWSIVSQVYQKKHLLHEILTCIHSERPKIFSEMCEEDLALEVKKGLQRNKYLIVLDDIWDIEVWNDLEAIFPENRNGSRVIMTSRNHDIAASRSELNEGPHYLRRLTQNESWDLLNIMLYPGKKEVPSPKLSELRIQIVDICQGLPLTIVVLAGILAKEDQYYWDRVVEGVNSSIISSTGQCAATFELSYQHLPDNLKPCFLYFGAFPEDHEHTIEDLICLWIGEGFVQKTQVSSVEDVANEYLMGLISRSLVIVSKQSSTGGVEACRIHDLLHEFCVRKCIEDNFLQFIDRYDEPYNLPTLDHLRRVCINYDQKNFCNFRLFAPTLRSLSFSSDVESYQDIASTVRIFKLVRVLDLRRVDQRSTFPREVGLFVHLRYLAIQGNMYSIPSSIGNLLNLETFIIVEAYCGRVSLPDSIWNLEKLRHLQVKGKSGCPSWFDFPTDKLDNAPKLCALHTLSSVRLPLQILDKILRQFPNVRKLKCLLWNDNDTSSPPANTIQVLDFLIGLETLTLNIIPHRGVVPCPFEFQFSLTIRELTLDDCRFPWSKMSAIGELPNLEVIVLDSAFHGELWNIEEEGFSKVQFLKLSSLNIVKWTASECVDCFPSLRKLVLTWCPYLEVFPSNLGRSTLETIEVRGFQRCENSIKQLQEEQMESGNIELKIILEPDIFI